MPRPLRIEYSGAIYHVINRGDRREAIYLEAADREMFLTTLGQTCQR
jgi:REP-associated tyrosine transposase